MRIKLDETLRYLRAERGISQKELADCLSVTIVIKKGKL